MPEWSDLESCLRGRVWAAAGRGEVHMHSLWRASEKRLRELDNERVPEWVDSDLVLLRKPLKDATFPEKWRPLCLVVALLELYSRDMWQSLWRTWLPLPECVVGFRPGRQPMELLGFLQGAISRTHEWVLPLMVLSIDVHAGCLAPRHVAEQRRPRGDCRPGGGGAARTGGGQGAAARWRHPRSVADAREGDLSIRRQEPRALECRCGGVLACCP